MQENYIDIQNTEYENVGISRNSESIKYEIALCYLYVRLGKNYHIAYILMSSTSREYCLSKC
jgi:hypothetical protein